jgi:hypothetical protein
MKGAPGLEIRCFLTGPLDLPTGTGRNATFPFRWFNLTSGVMTRLGMANRVSEPVRPGLVMANRIANGSDPVRNRFRSGC